MCVCVSFRTLELIELSCRMTLVVTLRIEGTGTNHLPSNNVQSKGWTCVLLAKGNPIIRHIRYLAVLSSQPAYKLRVMITTTTTTTTTMIVIIIMIMIIIIIMIMIMIIWCHVMQYNVMQYNTIHHNTLQCNKIWYKIMPIWSHKKGVGLQLTFSSTPWNLLQCVVIVMSEDL